MTSKVGDVLKGNRIADDARTVKTMIRIYCNGNHGNIELCDECRKLAEYAEQRLKNCKFKDKKPVCGKCTVHCYKLEMREKIKNVMKYSGPKMIYKHPVMLLKYVKNKVTY